MRRRTARGSVTCGLAAALIASCSHAPPTPPAPEPAVPPVQAPLVSIAVPAVTHRIEPGDTVWAISRRHRVSMDTLMERNGIREARKLPVGRVLEIPDAERSQRAAAQPVRTPAPDAGELASGASAGSAPSRRASYRVQPGDTVWRIAYRHGLPVEVLIEANGIEDVTKLRAGRLVAIPAATSSQTGAEPASGARQPRDLPEVSASPRAPVPVFDSVDEVLATGEAHLRAAEVDRALEMAMQALRLLEEAPDAPGAGIRIARAEVLAATVHVAYARRGAAIRSLRRALRADENLQLDPDTTSPKLLWVLEESLSELD